MFRFEEVRRTAPLARDWWLNYYAYRTASQVIAARYRKDGSGIQLCHDVIERLRIFRQTIRSQGTNQYYVARPDPTNPRNILRVNYGLETRDLTHITHSIRRAALNRIKQQVQLRRAENRRMHEVFRSFKGVAIPTIGGVNMQGGISIRLIKAAKIAKLKSGKKPLTTDAHFGIEVEFLTPFDRVKTMDAFADANLENFVEVKGDGSLHPDAGDHGHEICVLVKEGELTDVLPRVSEVLARLGAYVNDSCGMHTHIDMRSMNHALAYNNLVRVQRLLYRMCPSRRISSTYCRPVNTPSLARNDGDRYHGVNAQSLNRHRTIEIRIHHGTVDAYKIINWASMLVAIARLPEIQVNIRSLSGLRKVWPSIPKDLAAYINERVRKFKKQHSPNSAAKAA
jgi:hypothetical protein